MYNILPKPKVTNFNPMEPVSKPQGKFQPKGKFPKKGKFQPKGKFYD